MCEYLMACHAIHPFLSDGRPIQIAPSALRSSKVVAAPAGRFGPAGPGGPSGPGPTQSAVEVRDYFPETWLFQLQMTE